MAKWKELKDTMKVELEVGLELAGGSVLLTVAGETQGARLTTMVTELIQSREGRFGIIALEDCSGLEQTAGELSLAADLIRQRVDMERDRRRARGEAL